MRKRWAFALGLAFLAFLGCMAFLLTADQRRERDIRIAVTMYGADEYRWRTFTQGLRQGCADLGIENPVVLLADTQEALISRLGRETGAKGHIVAAAGAGEEVEAALETLSTPVFLVKTPVGDLPCARADDAAMATLLAEQLAKTEGHIALLSENLGRENNRLRREAFLAAMEAAEREVTLLEPLRGEDMPGEIASILAFHRPGIDVLVALDTETLEQAIDAYPLSMTSVALYGIGSSDQVVHALTQGMLQGVIFEDEYALGYIAARRLATLMGIAPEEAEAQAQYFYADASNMFDPDKERLLFPITQ